MYGVVSFKTNTRTHKQTSTHTYTHVYTHTYTHTQPYICTNTIAALKNIYKLTPCYIATHIYKYTKIRTLRSTNKLTLNAPEFSQTAFFMQPLLYGINFIQITTRIKYKSFLNDHIYFYSL